MIDSLTERANSIDHQKLTITDDSVDVTHKFDKNLEPLRLSALNSLRKHVATQYNGSSVGQMKSCKGAEIYTQGGSLICVTSVTVKNMANFWSGSWRGRYVFGFPAGLAAGKAVMTGIIRIHTHYFENGNTQMNDEKQVQSVHVEYHDASSFGTSIVKAIASAEDQLVQCLDSMYESMSGSALKEVRRHLPISGQKMNWNVQVCFFERCGYFIEFLQEHRMRKMMSQGKK